MKALFAGLFVLVLIASGAIVGTASAVSFDRNYSDPASDVVKLWTVNMTPVLLPDGNLTMTPFPDVVNILRIGSANASGNVDLTIQTKGDIANLDNTSYAIRLYTRADNASHFTVTYMNGTTVLTSNATGFFRVDISGNATIGPNPGFLDTLQISVAKSLLGTITAWNIDASATQRGSTYTYQDFGWGQPGNPGSAPPPGGPSLVLPNWVWIAVVPVVIALVVAIVIIRRNPRRRKESAVDEEDIRSADSRGKP